MNYNIIIWAVLLTSCLPAFSDAQADSHQMDVASQIRMIAAEHRSPGQPTALDDLRAYVRANDLDNGIVESALLSRVKTKQEDDVELKRFALNMLGYLGSTNTASVLVDLAAHDGPLRDAATRAALRVHIRHYDTTYALNIVTTPSSGMAQRRYAYGALANGLRELTAESAVSRTDGERSFHTNAISVLLLAITKEKDPRNMIFVDEILSKHADRYLESEERLVLMKRCVELFHHADGPNVHGLRQRCEAVVHELEALPQRQHILPRSTTGGDWGQPESAD